METPPHSSPLIPTTVPQARRAQVPPRVQRAGTPLRICNGPSSTAPRPIRHPPHTQARLDARVALHLQAEQELGTLPYPHTCPHDRRAGLAMAIVDALMKRVPPGGPLPTELRLFSVHAAGEITAGGPAEGIAFNVAAWPAENPPPPRPVNPSPDRSAWYPHDPMGLGGTEPDVERAAVTFAGWFLIRARAPR